MGRDLVIHINKIRLTQTIEFTLKASDDVPPTFGQGRAGRHRLWDRYPQRRQYAAAKTEGPYVLRRHWHCIRLVSGSVLHWTRFFSDTEYRICEGDLTSSGALVTCFVWSLCGRTRRHTFRGRDMFTAKYKLVRL